MRSDRRKQDVLLVAGVALAAAFGCLVLLRAGGTYVSPDETANAFFATRFAESGALSSFDPLNVDLGDSLHPRSVVSVGGMLLPGSFVGLPVMYGVLSAVFGMWTLPFWTPLFAIAAVLAWYAVTRKVFDREIGLLSAVLLAVHPAWWYYSARSLMHNVLFASLLAFAAYALVTRPSAGRRFARTDVALAGVCVGLALFVRTSEALWIVLAIVAAALAWGIRRIAWKDTVAFAAGCAVALLPLFAVNSATYGGMFVTGYSVGEQGGEGGEGGEGVGEVDDVPKTEATLPSSTTSTPPTPFLSLLFPFGISPKDIAKNVLSYGAGLFWWLTPLILIGVPLAVPARSTQKELRPARRAYLAFTLVACAYLAVMYGSWTFFDNPDPTQVTIGNSHVRYWIPVFALLTPFAAHAIRWIAARGLTETSRRLAVAAMVVACAGLGVRATFFSPQDGLAAAAVELEQSRAIRDRVLELTEPEAVIVVDRADKLFFPARRVRYPLRDDRTYALMPAIERRAPLYYYGITLPPEDLTYLNDVRLGEMGLKIEFVETFDIESLYRITRREGVVGGLGL